MPRIVENLGALWKRLQVKDPPAIGAEDAISLGLVVGDAREFLPPFVGVRAISGAFAVIPAAGQYAIVQLIARAPTLVQRIGAWNAGTGPAWIVGRGTTPYAGFTSNAVLATGDGTPVNSFQQGVTNVQVSAQFPGAIFANATVNGQFPAVPIYLRPGEALAVQRQSVATADSFSAHWIEFPNELDQ